MEESKLVGIIWEDAITSSFKRSAPKEKYLITRTSYGKVYYEDENVIVLINTEDEQDIEYTAIPKPWIRSDNRENPNV